MVGTRRSLPHMSFDLPDANDKSIPIDVRRLAINGKGTMCGEAPKPREEKVYHWRGAAYEVTDDTLQEWIDQEPERWKHKEAKDKLKAKERSDSLAAPPVVSRSTKRKSTSALEERNVDYSQRATKRQRTSLPPIPTKTHAHTRQHGPRALPTEPAESPRKFDFSREVGVHMLEYVKKQRAAARRKGYIMDALPTLKSREERMREAAGYHIAANVREMAALNTKIKTLTDQYDRSDVMAFLSGLKRLRREKELARERMADAAVLNGLLAATTETGSGDDDARLDGDAGSQSNPQLLDHRQEYSSGKVSHDAMSSSSCQESVPSIAAVTSPDLTRHSSATTPPPEEPETKPPACETDTKMHDHGPIDAMPSRNRGGQSLRWSLPRSQAPQLSARLNDSERAESAIYRGRMDGESKQARRRRIRREMAILRGLPEDEHGGDGMMRDEKMT